MGRVAEIVANCCGDGGGTFAVTLIFRQIDHQLQRCCQREILHGVDDVFFGVVIQILLDKWSRIE